ncbi:MAG: sigma-70 family RNA polymerase sigma factor [Terriglobales bacterium]
MARFSELSSIQLVKECIGSNDAEAWAEFIGRFQPVIAGAVGQKARSFNENSRELVDDLVQDTYLKLCEENSRLLRRFQPRSEDSIYSYLKVVAGNVALDHFKSKMADKRGANQTESIGDLEQVDPRTKGTDIVDCIHRNLQREQIEKIVLEGTKGKDQRRNCLIFRLHYWQGFTAREIAALPSIGLSTEGVESVLSRLLVMIRGHMRKAGTVNPE